MRRVPKRFEDLDPRKMVRIALRTHSEAEARSKAPAVAAGLDAYWEALAAGDKPGAAERYAAAVKIAATRGFNYRPIVAVATGDITEIVARLRVLESGAPRVTPADPAVKAVLGAVEIPRVRLSPLRPDHGAFPEVDLTPEACNAPTLAVAIRASANWVETSRFCYFV